MKFVNLFKNTSKSSGATYFRGSLTKEMDIVVVKNNFKTTDNHPDYIASIKIKDTNKLYELSGMWKEGDSLVGRLLGGAALKLSKLENPAENAPEYLLSIEESVKKEVQDFE